jgi:phosphoglycolate phosphatase-like HAD superfamily hydrolase
MKLSYEIARERYKVIRFDSVTYIGDEVWDVVASRNLGYKFIGIGSGDKAEKLRKEGAVQIVNDMTDKDLFFSKLGVSYRPIF